MKDHQIGSRLRQHILADLQRGTARDGRRLQALVGDLCSETTLPLVPALRHLVVSQPFQAALAQSPPLPTNPHLERLLQQELEQVFSTPICQRMEAVVRGLLDLPEIEVNAAAVAMPMAPPPIRTAAMAAPLPVPLAAPPAAPPPPAPLSAPLVSTAAEGSSGRGVVAVLSFMAGVLVVGMLGALGWLLQLSTRQVQPQLTVPAPNEQPQDSRPQTQPEPVATEPPPAPNLGQEANPDLAIASVQQLYTDISSGNMDAARQLFSPAAADQFDPTFFSQFQQVSVSDLRETGRDGTVVSLNGVVTFTYPDGTSQTEARSFTVDTASQPGLITGSSFGGVLKPRG